MITALDMQRARASAIARELVQQSPDGAILCVFAGGSLARGELWAAEIDGVLEVYSDIDLYAVVRDDATLTAVREAAARASAGSPGGAAFLSAPDIGVYTRADLHAQPPRPGTIDLPVHHILFHGDPSLPRGLPLRDPAAMPPDEALYLLENRLHELSAAGAETGRKARLQRVRALKARLDVHTAHAILARTFAPTLGERAAHFATDAVPGLTGAARDDVADAYRARADLATWLQSGDAQADIARAVRSLTRAWLDLAPRVLGVRDRPAVLVARRCQGGGRRENAREVMRLRRSFGVPPWRVLAAAPFLARLSPRAVLRADALVRALDAAGLLGADARDRHDRYLDRLTACFGFQTGSQEKRARAMHRVIS